MNKKNLETLRRLKKEVEERKQKLEKHRSLSLEEHYKFYENQNMDKKEIIKKIAKDRNKNKNEIYQYFLNEE